MRWAVVMVMVMVGCAPDDDPTDGVVSGSRLAISHWELGGARVLVDGLGRYHDKLRDEDCVPMPWTDGGVYCTPRGSFPYDTLELVYADAACTQPVAFTRSTCGSPPPTVRVTDARHVARLFEVGAARDATPYYRGGSSCFGPYQVSAQSPGRLFDVGTEILPAELVQMTPGTPRGTGRIRQRDWETADGSRTPADVYDQTLRADGEATMNDPTHVTIRPLVTQDVPRSPFFRDASCTHPAVEVPDGAPPPAVLMRRGDGCHWPSYLARGPEVTTQLYLGDPTACAATSRPPGQRWFVIGDPIQLPVLARGPRDTDDRIAPIYLTGDDITIRDQAVFDTRRGEDCWIAPFADGTHRCVGDAAQVTSTWFADPACMVPIQLAEGYDSSMCPAPTTTPHLAYEAAADGRCDFAIAKMFQISVRRDPAYAVTSAGCALHTGSALYELGDEVPATLFAEATLVTN